MYNTILVPLDGSKRSEVILPHVEQLAKNYQAKVFLVSVHEQTFSTGVEGTFIETDAQEQLPMADRAKAYLEEASNRFKTKDITCEYKIMHGRAVESILQIADEIDADLVAMASHGKSGLSRVFYGSVAAGIVNRIDRPFLMVRSRNI